MPTNTQNSTYNLTPNDTFYVGDADNETNDQENSSESSFEREWSPEGKEDLSTIQQFSAPARSFTISREGFPLRLCIARPYNPGCAIH